MRAMINHKNRHIIKKATLMFRSFFPCLGIKRAQLLFKHPLIFSNVGWKWYSSLAVGKQIQYSLIW